MAKFGPQYRATLIPSKLIMIPLSYGENFLDIGLGKGKSMSSFKYIVKTQGGIALMQANKTLELVTGTSPYCILRCGVNA